MPCDVDFTDNPGRAGRNPIYQNGPFATGPSPIQLTYYVDLSSVPHDVRIIRAFTNYRCSGVNPSCTDNGGTDFPQIEWSKKAIRDLNASLKADCNWPTAFEVDVTCIYSVFPSARLDVVEFEVEFIYPSTN